MYIYKRNLIMMMTKELRQIMAGTIESFTPGETTFKSTDGAYSARVYQTISREGVHCIAKLIEGYDMARNLNTIRVKHNNKESKGSKGVIKFKLLHSSDYIIGFYTNFADSFVERAEFHRTRLIYDRADDRTVRDKTVITPIEIKNSRCQLFIPWIDDDNIYCDMWVVIYLKKSLPDIKDAAVIAIDEVFVRQEKYIAASPQFEI